MTAVFSQCSLMAATTCSNSNKEDWFLTESEGFYRSTFLRVLNNDGASFLIYFWLQWSVNYYNVHLMASFPGQPGYASTSLDLSEARDYGVWGCTSISWTIWKQSAFRCRQITTPTHHRSIFTGRMLFLTPNQQRQRTEGLNWLLSRPIGWSDVIESVVRVRSPSCGYNMHGIMCGVKGLRFIVLFK